MIRTLEDLYSTVQIVRRGDTVYVRAVPRTVLYPTDGQLETRIKLGEIAQLARGKKGLCECHGLPWAAHYAKVMMSGYKAKERLEPKPKIWESRLAIIAGIAWVGEVKRAVEVLRSVLVKY
jgi:hypothetical protein